MHCLSILGLQALAACSRDVPLRPLFAHYSGNTSVILPAVAQRVHPPFGHGTGRGSDVDSLHVDNAARVASDLAAEDLFPPFDRPKTLLQRRLETLK